MEELESSTFEERSGLVVEELEEPMESSGSSKSNPEAKETNEGGHKSVKKGEVSVKDCVLKMLDEMEQRTESLRSEAMKFENERDDILSSLDTLGNSELICQLDGLDLEEINRYLERIARRCMALQVDVKTERSPPQIESLNKVNNLIDHLICEVKADTLVARKRCLAYLNACSETLVEEASGIDAAFETAVLGCSGDDQKRIRKRLTGLQDYFNSVEFSMAFSEECSQEK